MRWQDFWAKDTRDRLLVQLAEAIKGNTSLKLLDIGGNNIGPEGIKVLLEALRGNETLTTLELGYNPIGEEGAKHLADVIKYDLRVSTPFLCSPVLTARLCCTPELSWILTCVEIVDKIRFAARANCQKSNRRTSRVA